MGSIILAAVAAVLLIEFVLQWVYGSILLREFERKVPFNVEPAAPHPTAELVSFPTTGGLTLRGSLHRAAGKPSRGLVLFCPELGGNHWSATWYCHGLLTDGFDVLAFDFRNQGESDAMPDYEPLHWLTDYEVADVLAAVKFTRHRSDLRELPLGLFGISRGGGAALAAAAESRDVRCVAGEGVFANDSLFLHYTVRWAVLYVPQWLLKLLPLWHIKLTWALVRWLSGHRRNCRYTRLERRLPCLRAMPTLFIGGERDTYVHPDVTRKLSAQIGGTRHQLWMVPGAKHNMARQVDPDAYDQKLVAFFSKMSAPKQMGEEIKQPNA